MSRNAKIVLYSVLTGILVIILVIGVNMGNMMFKPLEYTGGGGNSFTAIQASPGEVQSIEGSFSSEDVRIVAADTDKITVKGYSGRAMDPSEYFTAELNGGELKISSGNYRRNWFDIFNFGVRCEITVPKDAEFESVEIKSSSGILSARGFSAQNLVLKASSGEVMIKDLTGDTAQLSAHSGMISTDNVGFNSLSAQADSGELVISGIFLESADLRTQSGLVSFKGSASDLSANASSGALNVHVSDADRIDLSTNSGSIECEIEDSPELSAVKAKASSGSVSIKLPEGTPYNPDIETFSGSSRTEGDVAPNGANADKDAVDVKVSTASGSVWVGY